MADIGNIFAQNLKALRAERGWNQNRLAEASGLSLEQVKRYETNASWVGKDAIAALARALSVPEARLFADPDAIPKPSKEDALALVAEALGLSLDGRRKPAPGEFTQIYPLPAENPPKTQEPPASEAEKLRADILAILPEIDSVSALDTVRDSLRTFIARRRAKGQNGGGLSSG